MSIFNPIKYDLLIGSEGIDTGCYEYFPRINKLINEPKTTFKKIHNLNLGIIEENMDDYVFAKYSVGDKALSNLAIQSAQKAFLLFRKVPLEVRVEILKEIRERLLLNKSEVLGLMIAEGQPKVIAEWEFDEMIRAFSDKTLQFYQREIIRRFDDNNNNEKIILQRKPDGVLGVCLPKNAPLSSSMLSLLALLAGNTIVLKPPLKNPISVFHVWKKIIDAVIIEKTNIKGVVNVIVGNSKEIFSEWMGNPMLKDVLYFGGSEDGFKAWGQACQNNKKIILELSGNDFMIVWKEIHHLEKASQAFIDGFIASSQVCMLPRKALIHHEIADSFIAAIIEKSKHIVPGLPGDYKTILSPVGKIQFFNEFLSDAINKGARLLCGGKRINVSGKEASDGQYIEPTIIVVEEINRLQQMRLFNEETFFPLLTVIPVKGDDDFIAEQMCDTVNSNPFGLRVSAWVRDKKYLDKFISEIDNCGMLRINSRHVEFSEYLPTHGGTGMTGGPYGSLNYLWDKTSHLQGVSIKDVD